MAPSWISLADRYVVNVALPAVIVAKMSQVTLSGDTVLPVVVAWGAMAVCAVMLLVVSRSQKWSRSVTGALLLVGVLGNTSFLGIGVVRSLLGDDHVAAAITYDQLGTFLALAVYGSWIAGVYGSAERGWRPIVRRLSRFAPFLALLLSLVLRAITLPQGAVSVLNSVGLTVAPVAMGALGLRFRFRVAARVRNAALVGLVVKMAAVPALVLMVGIFAGQLGDIEWSSAVVQSAAPPMVTAGVVAVSAGLDEDLVTFMVGVGTLLSFVSLPLLSLAV